MNETLEDIAQNSEIPGLSPSDIESLFLENPAGGGLLSVQDLKAKEDYLSDKGISRLIALGPFANNKGCNFEPVQDVADSLSRICVISWDDLILDCHSEDIARIRSDLRGMKNILLEIDWEKNSDTRAANYLALDTLYTLIHLYNYYEDYSDIGIVLFMAKRPFSGFIRNNKYKPEIPISAFEIRIILELRKRGYPLPPIFFLHGVFDKLYNYNSKGLVPK